MKIKKNIIASENLNPALETSCFYICNGNKILILLQDLPHEYVSPSMLAKVAQHGKTNKLYACEVTIKNFGIEETVT